MSLYQFQGTHRALSQINPMIDRYYDRRDAERLRQEEILRRQQERQEERAYQERLYEKQLNMQRGLAMDKHLISNDVVPPSMRNFDSPAPRISTTGLPPEQPGERVIGQDAPMDAPAPQTNSQRQLILMEEVRKRPKKTTNTLLNKVYDDTMKWRHEQEKEGGVISEYQYLQRLDSNLKIHGLKRIPQEQMEAARQDEGTAGMISAKANEVMQKTKDVGETFNNSDLTAARVFNPVGFALQQSAPEEVDTTGELNDWLNTVETAMNLDINAQAEYEAEANAIRPYTGKQAENLANLERTRVNVTASKEALERIIANPDAAGTGPLDGLVQDFRRILGSNTQATEKDYAQLATQVVNIYPFTGKAFPQGEYERIAKAFIATQYTQEIYGAAILENFLEYIDREVEAYYDVYNQMGFHGVDGIRNERDRIYNKHATRRNNRISALPYGANIQMPLLPQEKKEHRSFGQFDGQLTSAIRRGNPIIDGDDNPVQTQTETPAPKLQNLNDQAEGFLK